MSTLKADAVTTKSDNTDLTITGGGTGVPNLEAGFKVGGTAGVPISGLQVGTDGELITWDASGDPAAVAVGTATHVLTSNGAGAAPTFQAAGGGGAWNLIGTLSASDDATLTVTGLDTTYATYAIAFDQMIVEDDERIPYIRIGDSGGIISATNYKFNRIDQYSNTGTVSGMADNGNGEWQLELGVGNATSETWGGMYYLTSLQGVFPLLFGQSSSINHNGYGMGAIFYGSYHAATTVTQVQFLWAAGANATSGRMTVWGIAHA